MADYYPVLTRAISGLPSNDPQARRDLYARARIIVNEQLRDGGRNAAVEVLREQAALEAAIGRIEAEARSARLPISAKAAAAPDGTRAAIATPDRRVENTARSLSKILQAVQSDKDDPGGQSHREAANGAMVPSAAKSAVPTHQHAKPPSALGKAPSSLGTMLFELTYVVAAVAFIAVTYIHCIVWVYQGVIGYPVLLAVMAFTCALFIAPPVIIFQKTSSLPTIDTLWRLIHTTSRRVL